MKTITVNLSTDGINKALKELKKYRKELDSKVLRLVKELTEQGVVIAKLNADFMRIYDTGELLNGINSLYSSDGRLGIVSSKSDHAIFCEFGTGMRGKSAPYPVAILGWNYASGKTIHQTKDGRIGWYYPGDDGKWHFTEGMPSRPYMYDTARMLERFIEPIAKGVFK